jgi:hypothetical protein
MALNMLDVRFMATRNKYGSQNDSSEHPNMAVKSHGVQRISMQLCQEYCYCLQFVKLLKIIES